MVVCWKVYVIYVLPIIQLVTVQVSHTEHERVWFLFCAAFSLCLLGATIVGGAHLKETS